MIKNNKQTEGYRLTLAMAFNGGFNPMMASNDSYGNNGVFVVPIEGGDTLVCMASDQGGWEHVSVTLMHKARVPTWEEMCFVKDLFWSDDETVIQYHPRKMDYVNVHPFCLHLWKPIGVELPMPPKETIA